MNNLIKLTLIINIFIISISINAQQEGVFTDKRDGQTYKWIRVGLRVWMAKNLNYSTENSWCYDKRQRNCDKYGRLYTWKAALKACPEGWHLPTDGEWKTLITYFGDEKIAGDSLKTKEYWSYNGNGSNSSGFLALPAGSIVYNNRSFGIGELTGFWTSSSGGAKYAYYRYLSYEDDKIRRYNYYRTFAYSVRCIKDWGTK